jgi:co-chaperonin GroES (HSP10)
MLNEELVILNKIQKYLKESYQNIGDAMISGGIDNMEKYKYMMGQAHATGWRLVVLPFKMKEKTKGGLYIGQETIERQQIGSTCGLVLAMGPHCYDKEKFPEGPWCKKGDWIIFARYAGSRIQIDGGEVRMLNDDEVLATIDNPEDILHQY